MPNNPTPIISVSRLNKKKALADRKALIDIGFHYGTNGRNSGSFYKAWRDPRVYGLKLYMNHTTGEMLVEDIHLLKHVFSSWQSEKPILLHAEGVQLAAALALGRLYDRRLHVCHISQAIEVELIRKAKKKKQAVSAGVCPHHLFLIDKDREYLRGYAIMKPPLGVQTDQDALWEGLQDGTIDVVETDHAPHTKEEKKAASPPYGVPGLETALGLLFKAVKEGALTKRDVKRLLYDSPKKIFSVPDQKNTYIELDPDAEYMCGEDGFESKCGWSPFEGWKLYGKIMKVVFKGKTLLVDGKIV